MTEPPRLLITASVPLTLHTFLRPFAQRYRARGWRVDAAARGADQDPRLAGVFDAVHDLPWTRSPTDPVNLTAAPNALRALVQREKYDLVHAHDPVAGFVTRWSLRDARRRNALRVIYTAHGFHFLPGAHPVRNAIFWSLERVAAPWGDRLIVMNDDDERAASHWPVQLVRMRGIGIDLAAYDPNDVSQDAVLQVRQELGLEEDAALFLMVAELNPGKRHRDALDALALSQNPNTHLAFAGTGPEEEALRAQAEALRIQDRVHWLGWRKDIPSLLQASRALLLPSDREGLPRCIMEALALNRPVIATRIRGIKELVSENVGRLVPVGDPAALAEAIDWFASHPEKAERMGSRGRAAMAPYALPSILAAHDVLYAELLDEIGRTALLPATRSATPAMESDVMPAVSRNLS